MKLFGSQASPTIRTQRLLLRIPTQKDASTYHQVLSCPETSQFSDLPRQPTQKRSELFVRWMSKLHKRGKGAAWLICIRKSNLVIGAIRINNIDKKAQCGMLAYELHPTYWGKGYATEALQAIVHYAHVDMSLHRLEAWTTAGNSASEKVLSKNGFQYEGTQREKIWFHNKFSDIRLFGRLADDTLPS